MTEAPFLPWSEFLPSLRWSQGEHVSLIGPTGTGKTTLGLALLPKRTYVVAIGTKPKDSTLATLRKRGYSQVSTLPTSPATSPRVLVWPPFSKFSDMAAQRATIGRALSDAFTAGGWCVFADEVSYLSRRLRLADPLVTLWQQGRSVGNSVISCTQRPSWVPLEMYSEATHLFLWRTNDAAARKRLGDMDGADAALVRHLVSRLDATTHECLYVNVRTGQLCRTRYTPG